MLLNYYLWEGSLLHGDRCEQTKKTSPEVDFNTEWQRMNCTMDDFNRSADQDIVSEGADDVCVARYEALAVGREVAGRYLLEERLGRGGFSIVFAARDALAGERVALKFLNPRHCGDRKFALVRRELAASRSVVDPRLVRLYMLEEWQGIHFFVMELLIGHTLQEELNRRGALPWSEARPLFLEVLGAVVSLHERRILHRDLKPANVFLMSDGRVKLLDFGLAMPHDEFDLTSPLGEVMGTPQYMAPEQLVGGKATFATDVYQLGVLLYVLLTGDMPFACSSTSEVMLRKICELPILPRGGYNRLPPVVRGGLRKAMARREEDRFPSAAAMARHFASGVPPWCRWLRLAMGSALLLTLIGCSYLWLCRGPARVDGNGALRTATNRLDWARGQKKVNGESRLYSADSVRPKTRVYGGEEQ